MGEFYFLGVFRIFRAGDRIDLTYMSSKRSNCYVADTSSKYYNLNVRKFDRELAHKLKVKAAQMGRTIGGLVDEACREWLKSPGSSPGREAGARGLVESQREESRSSVGKAGVGGAGLATSAPEKSKQMREGE